ncbi:hypothetical protein ACFC0C_31680 [Streptomyces sp. NPDC056178]|uniref:hypothetical protein n=1 Tax=Streptomyces sp. NPDC056178 TaxID=3345735 RepID=UPI0035D534D1
MGEFVSEVEVLAVGLFEPVPLWLYFVLRDVGFPLDCPEGDRLGPPRLTRVRIAFPATVFA